MSIRPGNSDSRTPNCSATTSGRWLGSITPPVPDPDRPGRARDGGGQHGRRGTGDPGHAVVLGDPDAVVAEPLQLPRQPHGVAQRLGVGVPLAGAGAVEDGEPGRFETRDLVLVLSGFVILLVHHGLSAGRTVLCSLNSRSAVFFRGS